MLPFPQLLAAKAMKFRLQKNFSLFSLPVFLKEELFHGRFKFVFSFMFWAREAVREKNQNGNRYIPSTCIHPFVTHPQCALSAM